LDASHKAHSIQKKTKSDRAELFLEDMLKIVQLAGEAGNVTLVFDNYPTSWKKKKNGIHRRKPVFLETVEIMLGVAGRLGVECVGAPYESDGTLVLL
jgi:hypothetical protein